MLAIYTRLSREDEESTSIENQLQEGKEFARLNNFDEFKIYNEGEGVSGTLDIEERPEFSRLLQDILKKKFQAVWFRNQNRLERNSLTFHLFISSCKKTNTKVYFADKEFNYTDAKEFLSSSIISILNNYSPNLQSEQTKKVLKSRIQQGKAHGILPYGYGRDEDGKLIIDKKEAEVVKMIYSMSLQGNGYGTIAKYLIEKGYPTRYNKLGKGTYKYTNKFTGEVTVRKKSANKWVGKSVGDIIKNPIHKGERQWNGETYKVPEIVTPEHWQQVNDNLKNNMNNPGKKTHYKYLLKGFLTCGKCGSNMYGRINRSNGDNTYICLSKRYNSCGSRSINISKLEDFIWRSLILEGRITDQISKEFMSSTSDNKLEALTEEKTKREQEVQFLIKKRETALELVLDGLASKEELKGNLARIKNKLASLKEEIDALNKQLTAIKNSVDIVNKYRYQFDFFRESTPFEEKRELLKNFIERIIITSTDTHYEVEIKYKIDIEPQVYTSTNFKDAIFIGRDNCLVFNRERENYVMGRKDEAIGEFLEAFKNKKNNGSNGNTPPPNTSGSTPPPTFNGNNSTQTKSVTFDTATDVALVGGGAYPQPGEISLSHNGVLFLDELPEFKRSVLEVMRQPLEDREVTISRARFTVTYPSSFMLVASMNPSPSGYFNDPGAPVTSSPVEMQRYLSKISGPLLDRIDIHIEVTPVPFEKLSEERRGESSVDIRERVTKAREKQTVRFEDLENVHYNAQMSVRQIRKYCALEEASKQLLKTAMEKLNLSARAYDRILKVSRTIADLEGAENIKGAHISEAIQYRSLDRDGWLG